MLSLINRNITVKGTLDELHHHHLMGIGGYKLIGIPQIQSKVCVPKTVIKSIFIQTTICSNVSTV